MLSVPIEILPSLPPAALACRSASEPTSTGQSFGQHLQQARSTENGGRRDEEPRSGQPTSTTDAHTNAPAGADTAKPADSNTSGNAPHANPSGNAYASDETDRTSADETGAADKDTTVSDATGPDTESLSATATATLIAQAAPLVVVQVSTDDATTGGSPAEGDVESPTLSSMHRAVKAKGATKSTGSTASGDTTPGADPVAPARNAKGTAATDASSPTEPAATGQAAIAPVRVGEQPSASADVTSSAVRNAALGEQSDPISAATETVGSSIAEPVKASDRKTPEGTAHRQAAAGRHDSISVANASAALTSVAVVTPGISSQQVSVTTVSAAPRGAEKVEGPNAAEIADGTRSDVELSRRADVPSAEAQHNATLRETAEPTRQARDTSGPQHTETGRANLTEAERVRFVQRVARAVHTAVDRGGEIRLRLSPPELGKLTLDVVVRDGVMNAHLEAETHSARSLLIDNLPALRDRLAEQNVRIERFDVNLRGGTSGSLPDRTPDQSGQHLNHHASEAGRPRVAAAIGNRPATSGAVRQIQTNDQLNVVV